MFDSKEDFLAFVDDMLKSYNLSETVRHFICCQSALETSFGYSRICLENHNLFGMKEPYIRPTMCLGSSRGHAKYHCYYDSVVDYMLWLSWSRPLRPRLSDLDAYASFLVSCHYAEDKDYIDKIKRIYLQYYG